MKWSYYTKLLQYTAFHWNSVLPKSHHVSINKFGLILENAFKLWNKMNAIRLLERSLHL